MVGSQTFISVAKMRNKFLNRNKTTWANADTRVNPQTFYELGLNQKIAIREMGGDAAFSDFVDHLWNMGDLKHEKGRKQHLWS